MTRLSFAIVVLIFFNPVIEVWRRLIEEPPALQAFGFAIRVESPYVGTLYLIVLAFVTWVLITLLLIGLEAYFKRDVGGANSATRRESMELIWRRQGFRDGVILISAPSLIYYPEVLAKWVFWIVLIKLLIVSLVDFLLKIPTIVGLFSPELLGKVTTVLNALRGTLNGQVLELMMLALCFLILILMRYFYLEKDYVFFNALKEMQRNLFEREKFDPGARHIM
ncbi:MAG: hypothetical protein HS100_04480 [Anaerolineales bacterium]|nr:hypothetical protein [Anaerolineales bacterium]